MLGAVILAGGEGDRIGGDKPFTELGGKNLVSYVLEAASKVSDEIVVVVGADRVERFETLLPDVHVAVDIASGGGPLIGVYSGLRRLRSEYAVALPCDSPFISETVLRYLIGKAEGVDAAIPRWPNGYLEPLHSVYRASAALRECEEAMERGGSRIHSMIERLERTAYVPVEELRRFDPDLLTFFNINSVEDLERAEAILKLKGRKK